MADILDVEWTYRQEFVIIFELAAQPAEEHLPSTQNFIVECETELPGRVSRLIIVISAVVVTVDSTAE